MNVIKRLGEIRSNLHSGNPTGQDREVQVLLISQTIGEISSIHEVVHEVNVVARDASANKLDYADVVATADHREAFSELIQLEFATELALENNDVSASESTSPRGSGGGGGITLGEEIVGGGANFREVIDVGVFREAISKTRERVSAGDGGVGGESETGGARVSGRAGVRSGWVGGRRCGSEG